MIRGALAFLALASVAFFPWPLAATFALFAASLEPLLPLAAGIFADMLYFAPQAHALPFFTLAGVACTLAAFFVRSRVRASLIR